MMNPKEQELKKQIKIEELRLLYEREEQDKTNLELKASALFIFASILLTILVFLLDSVFSMPEAAGSAVIVDLGLITILGMILIFSSCFPLLNVIKIKYFMTPLSFDPNEIQETFELPLKELEEYIIEDYRRSIPQLHCINDKKVNSLEISMKRLKWGSSISLFTLILISCLSLIVKLLSG